VQGPLSITIDLSEQKAQIFKGKTNVGWTYVATGLSTHPTPRGNFRIMERKIDKTSNKYGVIENAEGQIIDFDAAVGREKVPPGCRYVPAPMPYWMRLTSYGVGMHQGPIPDPGSPASHGCIRMPEEMARNLFFASKNGTPVTIKP
jgi:lipoprotein-anchoring transpeptidase ErfK/SrfK